MGVPQGALLRVRRLIALLETTAVGNAAKNAGDQLRIVHQAKPEEKLVLFVEIGIHAGIKSVAIFPEFG